MDDEYLERLAAMMPEAEFARYLDIREAISQRRAELRDLQEELIRFAQAYGVPGIDHPGSQNNEMIRQKLAASAVEINSVWASTPPDWVCPCCRRTKAECARTGSNGQMLGKFVAHHDHFEDRMDVALGDISKDIAIKAQSSREIQDFIRRGVALLTRFDRIVICEDCNNAEARAKAQVSAVEHFTFTPREISCFVRPESNRAHQIDLAALNGVYAKAQEHFVLRAESLAKLAKRAMEGKAWYEPIEFKDREEQVDRQARGALEVFGIGRVGYGAIRDIFFESRKIDPKHAPAWRTKARLSPRVPTEEELKFATQGNARFGALPVDWACPCCSRPKRDVVRWSKNSKQFRFTAKERSVPDETARYGTRKIILCDDCDHTFRECHKELRKLLGDQQMPDRPVSLEEIRAIIRPRPHGMHDINAVAAEELVERVLSMPTFE